MIEITNYPIAVAVCFLAMICWGSWQNTQKFTGRGWNFELFYWDFALGILLMSIIYAFTLGSFGSSGRSFVDDIGQASYKYLGYAVFAGIIWNLGTLLLVRAIAIAGMATAFTIGGGLAWLLGIILNYIENPSIYNPTLLYIGLGFIVVTLLFSYFAYKRQAESLKKPTLVAVLLSICVGILVAFYYVIMVRALDPDFSVGNVGKLTSYTAVVFFSIGAFISTIIFNPFFMRRSIEGGSVSMKQYFSGTRKNHTWGVAGGMIWSSGNAFSFMAVSAAGSAISYGLSNAAPLVAAIWGIFVWKEFKGATTGIKWLLFFMFVFYLISLTIIILSRI